MKKYITKENVKILISLLCLLIIVCFYILSPLLNNVFSGRMVLIVTILGFLLLASQVILTLLKVEKIKLIVKTINEYVQVFLVAIILVQFIFTFIMFPATVSQNSMLPTLMPEDRLIIKCTDNIENKDIIVFEYDNTIEKANIGVRNKELLIKRVIAKEGQTFYYKGKDLYIDGILVEDEFAVIEQNGLSLKDVCEKNGMLEQCLQEDVSYKIPEGWYFVMGDNRQYTSNNHPLSIDSRSFGLVHESQIFGKVEYRIQTLFKWVKI
jgi:signal peptidase I